MTDRAGEEGLRRLRRPQAEELPAWLWPALGDGEEVRAHLPGAVMRSALGAVVPWAPMKGETSRKNDAGTHVLEVRPREIAFSRFRLQVTAGPDAGIEQVSDAQE